MSESIAGTGRIDAVTISHQPDGTRGSTRRVSSIGTDAPSGSAESGGYTYLLLHGTHGRLVAYDFAGDRLWAHRLTDETLLGLVGLRMIGGYLMATGTVSLPAGSAIFTTAFTEFAVPVWTKTFGGPAHDAIASDSDVGGGTVLYVTGSYTDGTTRKITTMGYEPHDGFRFWRRSIAPQTPTDFDVQPHVAVSSDGGVIAVAATSAHLGVSTFLTREYQPTARSCGRRTRTDPPTPGTERRGGVGFSNTAVNVYVVGQGTNTGGQEGAFLVAYGSMGPPFTFERAVPPTNVDDVARVVDTGNFADRVVVASRVGEDIRVDAYSQS